MTCALIILLFLQISQSHHVSRGVSKRNVLSADIFYHKILQAHFLCIIEFHTDGRTVLSKLIAKKASLPVLSRKFDLISSTETNIP